MSGPLTGRTVLLVIGGGIAAYKGLETLRALMKRGARVVPVLTSGAQAFVTPLSAAALAGEPAHTELLDLTAEAQMGHIELSRSADLIVVAPATANLMARMAHGLADDLAATLLLATDTRILLAPAMNVRMWLHPATQRNLRQLETDGVHTIGPETGDMACGEHGPGRMAEPDAIAAEAERLLLAASQKIPLPGDEPWPDDSLARTVNDQPPGDLLGRRAIVTAGPTHEPIDPVRYIANRSSGRQGYEIARALADRGAHVTLVSGPVRLADPKDPVFGRLDVVRVETA
ncbi:MAG: flavoprotein, partial [Pseudomonadota bacterium]